MSIFPIDLAIAAKALRLARQGLKGKAIGERLRVSTYEANLLASIGQSHAGIEAGRLTEPELALLNALAAIQRERLVKGEVSTPKGWMVSARCRKADGWAAATAAKRLGSHRKGEPDHHHGSGLNLVHASRNGHIWMLPAGWALIHALEAR